MSASALRWCSPCAGRHGADRKPQGSGSSSWEGIPTSGCANFLEPLLPGTNVRDCAWVAWPARRRKRPERHEGLNVLLTGQPPLGEVLATPSATETRRDPWSRQRPTSDNRSPTHASASPADSSAWPQASGLPPPEPGRGGAGCTSTTSRPRWSAGTGGRSSNAPGNNITCGRVLSAAWSSCSAPVTAGSALDSQVA